MWCLRDYNDELIMGKKAPKSGSNNLEKVIVEGLDGNENLVLGTNPHNDMIFKKIMGLDPAIRDLIINFQKALPPSEREKMGQMGKGPVSIGIPQHLLEIGGAVSAYYSQRHDLLKQFSATTLSRYLEDRNSPERMQKHKELVERFRERDAKLRPWFTIPNISVPKGEPMPKYQNSFNPAFELFLEFFSEPAHFLGRPDPHYYGMMVSQYGRRGQMAKLLCNQIFTFAVPCEPVLRYMVENSPNKRIAEIGAGSGYWANLLTRHGADVVANDNNSEGGSRYFPVVAMDGEKYVKDNKGFPDRAIFFCWPRGECLGNETVCMPERTLPQYKGKDLYFVGEVENGCTFDMDLWVNKNKDKLGWKLVKVLEIPNFLGTDDKFYHYRRA